MSLKPIHDCRDRTKKYILCSSETALPDSISSRSEKIQNIEAQFVIRNALDRERQAYLLIQKLNEEHDVLIYSLSWRITMPLRWISLQLMLLKKKGLLSRFKAIVVRVVVSVRCYATPLVSSFPYLHRSFVRVESFINKYTVNGFCHNRVSGTGELKPPMVVEELSAGARSIYSDLSDIIDERRRNNQNNVPTGK